MLAIGCDHAGYELKQEIIKHLEEKGIEYKDFGCYSEEAVDYPVYGKAVAHAVADGYHAGMFFQRLQEAVDRLSMNPGIVT